MAEEVPTLIRASRHRLAMRLVVVIALAGGLAVLIFWGSGDRRRAENRCVVRAAAERLNLQPELLMAVAKVESGFDDRARSPKGALGLLQVMPGTGKEVAGQLRLRSFDLLAGKDNALIGGAYLKMLIAKYRKDLHLALAAYHAGPNRVDAWVKKGQGLPGPEVVEMFGFAQTGKYVADVLQAKLCLERLAGWGVLAIED